MKAKSLLAAVLFSLAAQSAPALNVSSIYMFGDSGADSGSMVLPDGTRMRPINDGQLWIETVATRLGREMRPAVQLHLNDDRDLPGFEVEFAGGNNYAVGGATVARWGEVTDGAQFPVTFSDQLYWFAQQHGQFAADDLVFIQFDSNDVNEARSAGVPYDPSRYAAEWLAGARGLKALGARNIVAVGDTLASLFPDALYRELLTGAGLPADYVDLGIAVHRAMVRESREALLPALAELDITYVDLDPLAMGISNNPSAYGFLVGEEGYLDCELCPSDGHVFTFDGHYTSQVQTLFADETLRQLGWKDGGRPSPVPVPAAVWMFASALGLLAPRKPSIATKPRINSGAIG